eukprot:NP_499354.2 Uncharacterized protein CELE_Y39A1A.17 [Caenorhabditis elegans]
METIKVLRKQELRSFVVGCEENTNQYTEKNEIDIISVLRKGLNNRSQQKLLHLGLNGQLILRRDWINKLNNMLPSLRSFDMSNSQLDAKDFFRLCKNFPNLEFLDIRETGLSTISGLNRLQNLQILKMQNMEFHNHFDIIDLFGLTKLKILDVSCNRYLKKRNIIKLYIECDMVLPELQLLDCSMTDFVYFIFEVFQNFNSSKTLEVGLVGTIIEYIDKFDDEQAQIAMLHSLGALAELEKFDSLRDFFTEANFSAIENMLNRWNDNRGNVVLSILVHLLNCLETVNPLHEKLWKSSNNVILEFLLNHSITANTLHLGKTKHVLKTSKGSGQIFWALLTIKNVYPESEEFRRDIQESEILHHIRSVQCDSMDVMLLKKEVINLFN